MLSPAPATLGTPEAPHPFGRYYGAIPETDTAPWDKQNRWRRRYQRKSWIYAGVFTEEWFLGFAIADAGYLGLGFVYYFHRASGLYFEEKATRPFYFPASFQPELRGHWQLETSRRKWRVSPLADDWRFEFQGKRLHCDLIVRQRYPGLTAIAPALHRPFNSTYKVAGLPVEGSVSVDGKPVTTLDAGGAIDFTLGYPARNTFWNWACLVGTTEDGKPLGINLVAHFNEGLENALWIDGALAPLAQAQFIPGRDRRREIWRIDTADDALEIEFTPEGARAENLRLGLVESRFIQPFGTFRGILRDGPTTTQIKGYGVVEEHRARW